jgi:lipopolysaccharide export LptBFGC system permease protein LptF
LSRATRLLLAHGARWLAVSLAATALLVLLVDWVELGARLARAEGGASLTGALQLALLLLPAHVSRAAPFTVALGSALTVVGLRRSGEWQALGAAGLGPGRLIAPLVALGLAAGLGAAALDAWVVPGATRAQLHLLAQHEGRPLRHDGATWLYADGQAFRLEGDPVAGTIAQAYAFSMDAQQMAWAHAGIRWEGLAWACEGGCVEGSPWGSLPPPQAMAQLLGPEEPSALGWAVLGHDTRPSAAAERWARLSRPVASPLAALLAAAISALLAPGSLAVLLAAAPVLAWELLATGIQTQVGLGRLPGLGIPVARLGLAALLALLAWRRLGRPRRR